MQREIWKQRTRLYLNALGVQITAIQELAHQASSGWEFTGIDDSAAPLRDVSIGAAFESLLNAPFGSAGTLTVAALVTSVLKDRAGCFAGGLCGPDDAGARGFAAGTTLERGPAHAGSASAIFFRLRHRAGH